ncbi:MAG: insulinase family protein [Bacteroidia bacterium]|nr:insulinase family protein [Bacteroidia bacterium]
MNFKFRFFLFLALTCFLSFQGMAQAGEAPELATDAPMPLDPNVRMGTLPNGLKYYIRVNKEPEKRAELRLAVNAGSMQETDEQQGLAHFVEHMAFNGTKNFQKSELVDYLESVGTKFGPHLNAYTSFDETVYMLQIPTDNPEIVENGFKILGDWAGGVAFEDEEIDKERGVVIEEWRLGQGAQERMRKQYFPVLFKDSRYAERLPIGKKEILENFEYQTVKNFYKTWYRPNLMAVVAVGDLDPDKTEAMIKEKFSGLSNPDLQEKKIEFPVPDHKETLVKVVTDPESPQTLVQIIHKYDKKDYKQVNDYRKLILSEIFSTMLSNRMMELTRKADPPFVAAFNFDGAFIRSKSTFASFALVKPDGIEKGLEAILRETERVRQHGFTESELERTREELMKEMKSNYKEKDKTESRSFAQEYVSNFLSNQPMPGIEMEYKMYQDFLPNITLKEINDLVDVFFSSENQVVIVAAPEKEGMEVPNEDQVRAIMAKVAATKVEAYVDEVSSGPLLANMPTPGPVVSEQKNEGLGLVEWKMKNGARVIIKQTDFKEDEILFRAFSPGGSSRYPDNDFHTADNLGLLMANNGVGKFDENSLQKKLAGKKISIGPNVTDYFETMAGECSPEDLEDFLQLMHLYFTQPRQDKDAFESQVSNMKGMLATMGASPEMAFQDSLTVILANHHPRKPATTPEIFDHVDQQRAFEIYLDRFSDASDFTFIFVGNIDPTKAKGLIETYIGGLPGYAREESWKDLGITAPKGVVERTVYKGVEPKSLVTTVIHGPVKFSQEEDVRMEAMVSVLRIMLREALREEKGGTYFVRANHQISTIPHTGYKIQLGFGCAPDNVADLTATMFAKIEELKKDGPSDKNLQKVLETMRRSIETDYKENDFWIKALDSGYRQGFDLNYMLEREKMINALTAKEIKKVAKKYLNTKNYVQVVLKPETAKE